MDTKEKALINFLKKRGGLASYGEIYEAGFNRTSLGKSLNSGEIQKLDRGLYRLSTGISLSNPDLVAVSIKVSNGVICLLSRLLFMKQQMKYLNMWMLPLCAGRMLIK